MCLSKSTDCRDIAIIIGIKVNVNQRANLPRTMATNPCMTLRSRSRHGVRICYAEDPDDTDDESPVKPPILEMSIPQKSKNETKQWT